MKSLARPARGVSPAGWSPTSAASAISFAVHRVLGLALIFVVAVNVFNALGRYLLGFTVTGTDELMVYTMIWVVMTGTVLSLACREHIGVNLLPSYATGRLRHLLHCVHDLAALAGCAYAAYAAYAFVIRIAGLGTTSMGLGLPMTVPHAALLVGFGILTLIAAMMLVRSLIGLVRNDPHASEVAA